MAGDWIPYTTDLPRKPEVLRIASLTGQDRFRVVGLLLSFWSFVDEQSEDGVVRLSVREVADTLAQISENFLRAMASVGWLEIHEDRLSVPNFTTWMGQSAKRRLKDGKRKRHERSVRKPSAKCPKTVRNETDKSVTRVQDSTGENTEEKTPPSPPAGGGRSVSNSVTIPAELDAPSFHDAWERWLRHRRETRHTLKPTTMASQLRMLAGLGLVRAIACIEHTITMGWQGLREPDAPKASNGKPPFAAGIKQWLAETGDQP